MSDSARKTILIVEDESIIALEEKKLLMSEGFNVLTASSGERAVGLVEAGSNAIDLILMDIDLGDGMDGTKAAECILRRCDIPILFLSSHTEKELVERTKKITSYGYVVKNSGDFVLLASIEMAFKLYDASRAIRMSEEKYSKAFHLSPDSVTISRIDDGTFVAVNRGFIEITGYSADEAMGHSPTSPELPIWAAPEERRKVVDEVLATGDVTNRVAEFRAKDGRKILGLMSGRVIMMEGRPHMLSIIRDITELKSLEASLREKEARNHAILEAIPDMMFLQDAEGVYLDYHAGDESRLLLPPAKFLGKPMEEIFPADLSRRFHEAFKRVTESKHVEVVEYTIPVGTDIGHFEARMTATGDGHILSVVRDISEWKRADIRLRDSEMQLNDAQRIGNIGSWMWDLATNAMTCSDQLYEILGIPRGTTMNAEMALAAVHPDDRAFVDERSVKAAQGETLPPMEFRIVRPDGTVRHVRASIELDRGPDGTLHRIAGIHQDITDRKRAEESLRKSENQFSAFMDHLPAAAFVKAQSGRTIFMNEYLRELLGAPTQWQGKTTPELIPGDLGEQMAEDDRKVLAGGPLRIRETVTNPQGSVRYFETVKFPIRSENEPLLLGGISMDMTEIHRAQEAVQRSEQKFSALFNLIPHAIVISRTSDGEIAEVNDGFLRVFKCRREDVIHVSSLSGKVGLWKDRRERERLIELSRTKGGLHDFECSLIRGDGSSFEAMVTVLECVVDGVPSFISIIRDSAETRGRDSVFDQHRDPARERDRAGADGLSRLTDDRVLSANGPSGHMVVEQDEAVLEMFRSHYAPIILADPDTGRIVVANPAAASFYGFTMEELRSMSLAQFSPFGEEEFAARLRLVRNSTIEHFDSRHRRADGEIREVEVHSKLVTLHQKSYLYSVVHDVTDRRRNEEKLRLVTQQLSSLVDKLAVGVLLEDRERRVVRTNEAFCTMFGVPRTPGEIIGTSGSMGAQWAKGMMKDPEGFVLRVDALIAGGVPVLNDLLETVDGRTIERDYIPILSEGQVEGHLWTHREITQRVHEQAEITRLLQEKEMLLKEVHHRIKNNMTIVTSLLSLHAQSTRSGETVAALKDAIARIKVMSVLYDKLFRGGSFTRMSAKVYLPPLIEEIVELFSERPSIAIEEHIDDIVFDSRVLVPLGIILNELLTNTMKYAFPGRHDGRVVITLAESDMIRMTIKDNGRGFVESSDAADSRGFGLTLVSSMSEQLGGTVTIDHTGGTTCTVAFTRESAS